MSERFNPFAPMPEESLNSFVLRTLAVNGYHKECSWVISSSGWILDFSVPYNTKWLFDKSRQPELFSFFRENSGSARLGGVFDSPIMAIKNYRKVFAPEKPRERKSLGEGPIGFCKKCFEEQLSEFGFCYFKRDWTMSNVCHKHKIKLSYFVPDSRDSAVAIAANPMRYVGEPSLQLSSEPHRYMSFLKENYLEKENYKIASCAKHEIFVHLSAFASWIKKDILYNFPDDWYEFASRFDGRSINKSNTMLEFEVRLEKKMGLIEKRLSSELYSLIESRFVNSFYSYEDDICRASGAILKSKYRSCVQCDKCLALANDYDKGSKFTIGGESLDTSL
ncbi:TniQ family protein [Ferrimonas gelatinilytica]|uniref:Uncharacterized protein n=1 Tax=Ferrimonas gelatinilytica TaxID=1255257 RepID=A0ABP9RV16_9GAMM